jgi:hypothetical protein
VESQLLNIGNVCVNICEVDDVTGPEVRQGVVATNSGAVQGTKVAKRAEADMY